MPNQRMNSGTQAIEGIARSACMVGSSSCAGARGEAGRAHRARSPARSPSAKPAATRHEGRGQMAPRARRCGTARPASRPPSRAAAAGGASIQPARAAAPRARRSASRQQQAEHGRVTEQAATPATARRPARAPAAAGACSCSSAVLMAPVATSRRSRVEERVDGGGDVDFGLDHAAALQRLAGREDRLALGVARRADRRTRCGSSCCAATGSGSFAASARSLASSSGFCQRPLPAALVDRSARARRFRDARRRRPRAR